MSETAKADALRDFQRAAERLRHAAESAHAQQTSSIPWGPREVLAHITLWAVQAAEHFAHGLAPLNYGADGQWGPAMADTFNVVFETLAGPGVSPEDARVAGWAAVEQEGFKLPLAVPESDELHARVDDAFNAAAVGLVKKTPFEVVLRKTESAHAELYRRLCERLASEPLPGSPTYRRLLLIIAHHELHSEELERQADL